MKNLLLVAAVILMAACQSKIKQESANPKTESIQTNVVVVDQLLAKAETLVDKPVVVQGHVTHTCKHSGKRCFIVGDDANLSIRVEAGGQIQGFNRELVGNSIAVKGILKERRLTAEYIDQWEEKVQNQEAQEDGSAETCAAEMNNINNMRQWMEDNEKNYYSVYYINGENYDIVD